MEVLRANGYHCDPPLSVPEVHKIVEWFYTKFASSPQSIPAKKKKIWINPKAGLTTQQKRVIVGQQVGILRKTKTINELIDLYISLEKEFYPVTQKLLQEHSSFKLRTIKKYWFEIKEGALHWGERGGNI